MDVKAARRMPIERSTYGRVRNFATDNKVCSQKNKVCSQKNKVCSFWLEGKCTRDPCRFMHSVPPARITIHREVKASSAPKNVGATKPSHSKDAPKPQERLCQHWASGTCGKGDKCLFQHSWSQGEGFGLLAKLEGHEEGIVGIGLPEGSDKLYTGSRDGTVKFWNCHTGQCSDSVNMGSEVGSLICEGPWLLIGLRNLLKAWNVRTSAAFDLEVSSGLVYSMAVDNDLLFAGCQNGDILVWRGSTSPPHLNATLKGHTRSVVSLVVGAGRLYSGSVDRTIRVWDNHSLECITTLKGHTDVVMSLLCWDQYLLSCSLDRTIKVWVASSPGGDQLDVHYSHDEGHGVLALSGMHDMNGKPILLSACNNDTVHLYELPTFNERGRIFSRREVLALQVAPTGGLFFTGDGSGALNVWRWSGNTKQGTE